MVTISYKILFEIEVVHTFYTGGYSADLRFHPTPETEQRLRSYGLLWKQQGPRLIVLAPVQNLTDPVLLTAIEPGDNFRLSFFATLQQLFFLNFTDVPLQWGSAPDYLEGFRSVFYFDNLDANEDNLADPPIGDLRLLSDAAAAPVSDADRLAVVPEILNVKAAAANSLSISLENYQGQVYNFTDDGTEARSDFQFDLRGLPAGVYTLGVPGEADRQVYVSQRAYWEKPFAIVDIFAGNEVPASYRFVEENAGNYRIVDPSGGPGEKQHIVYHLYFANRQTRWRYIFRPSLGGGHAISISGHPANFSGDGNGEIFDSDVPIPLREKYQTVELDGNRLLPNPRVDRLGNAGELDVSVVFV